MTGLQVSQQPPAEDDFFIRARAAMVRDQLAKRGITNPRVLASMGKVPRQQFIHPAQRQHAYEDGPLSIGAGQTISQPYIVGLMTQLLDPQPDHRLLEIGVGSGYQAAVLAEIAREVVGIERIAELAHSAESVLRELGYLNVAVHVGDGTEGFLPAAPYNAILVSAVGPLVPDTLLGQLADGGRLVMPVGSERGEQYLERVTRQGTRFIHEQLIEVRFVPLIGRYGFKG